MVRTLVPGKVSQNQIIMNADLVKAASEVITSQQILVNMVSRRVRQLSLGHRTATLRKWKLWSSQKSSSPRKQWRRKKRRNSLWVAAAKHRVDFSCSGSLVGRPLRLFSLRLASDALALQLAACSRIFSVQFFQLIENCYLRRAGVDIAPDFPLLRDEVGIGCKRAIPALNCFCVHCIDCNSFCKMFCNVESDTRPSFFRISP